MTKCKHAASGCNHPEGECLGACMGTLHTPGPTFGRICISGYERFEDKGTPEFSGFTTTQNVAQETSLLWSYLELERAQRLRNVAIYPHAVGSLIVVSPNVSLLRLVLGWLKERTRARAVIAKATSQKGTK